VLHYFPNLPTASVRTRAEQLLYFLAERWRRRIIGPQDEVHLVGHSTGGLDLRQLLLRYRELEEKQRQGGRGAELAALEVLGRIRSVQFLSTPQRGTQLASLMSQPLVRTLLFQPLLRGGFESVRGLRERGTSRSARVLRTVLRRRSRRESDNWVDAFLDTLEGCHSTHGPRPAALARASYFELLRWLLHMASDASALSDVCPEPPREGAPHSPAHLLDAEPERHFLRSHDIRYASLATVAHPRSGRWADLFNRLHALTARSPSPHLGPAQPLRWLTSPGEHHMLAPSDNDGLVNTVSMVWPDPESCFLVRADHADVIGHFQAEAAEEPLGAWRRYDLLNSASGFGEGEFEALWLRIAAFAEGRPYHERLEPGGSHLAAM
jgi:triacylglycerol lipase